MKPSLRTFLAALLVMAALALSEYGQAALAASVALLVVLRRSRGAAVMLAGGALGYAFFRAAADLSTRPQVMPSRLLARVAAEPLKALASWASGLWYAVVGAAGAAVGDVRFDTHVRATLLAAILGMLAAVVAAISLRGAKCEEDGGDSRSLAALLLAIAAGLFLMVLGDRQTFASGYSSRFRVPVLPFTAPLVVYGVFRVARERYRGLAVAFIAFLCAYHVVNGAFERRATRLVFDEVGRRLRPFVVGASGLTVAVVPNPDIGHAMVLTPATTMNWSTDELRRILVMSPVEAEELIGPRGGCRHPDRVDTPPRLHHAERHGDVSLLLWLPIREGNLVGDAEPYCLGPLR